MFYFNIIPKKQLFIKSEPNNLNISPPTNSPSKKASHCQDLGLYIHIPFCRTICAYCAFPAFAHKNGQINDYLLALQQEIRVKSVFYRHRKLKTIYFGGGTPSLLETTQLERLLTAIQDSFDCSECNSIEIETNPESLTPEKIDAYRRLGLTRISVGVQTLDNRCLKRLARPHNAEAALEALENLSRAGFKNFSCDLIIGLPYQTMAGFRQDIRQLLSFDPAHLSVYFLMPDTPKISSFIADCPGEDEQIKMWLWADKKLSEAGYAHYEVSNYALPGFESKHNLRYWNRQEYLGVGLSAHSFLSNQVSENQDNFKEYMANPLYPKEKFKLEGDLATADYIMLALRKKEGIDLNSFATIYGNKDLTSLLKNADPYIKTSLLTLTEHRLQPTPNGWLILDKITRDLI